MAKKQFQTESKRILDLMVNSVYTHKEIFLRELLSNASDALDKLAYRALTDDGVEVSRADLAIEIRADREAKTLTISDNGIGMTREELGSNLGVIARSGSLQFKQELAQAPSKAEEIEMIGQFGVGFYSAFMVSSQVTVITRPYGEEGAWRWVSVGSDGYTITPYEKQTPGTDIILQIKEDAGEETYAQFLDPHHIRQLVKKYSDYIRYPILMEMEKSRPVEQTAEGEKESPPKWETYTQVETLNSMVPLWQRPKAQVTEEEASSFYRERFGDFEPPLARIHVQAEGTVTYKAMLYLPARAPFDFYTREYEKGLQLYSSGVMIMEKCPDLLPDHFRFVRGVVDSPDFSLNISREMLQHTRQLKVISSNIEKKIKAELLSMQKERRDDYEAFWRQFGLQIKYGMVSDFGVHKALLQDLLLFHCSGEGKPITLAEYLTRMKEGQTHIYYASGESVERLARLPQSERLLNAGYPILWLIDEVDEFIMQTLGELEGKHFKSVNEEDALPVSEGEKEKAQKQTEENRAVLDFIKETLGDRVADVRISKILQSHPVCMTADGPVSLEMEKYFQKIQADGEPGMKAQRVLELNPDSGAFAALRAAWEQDKERARTYAEILYNQALLIADLPIEDPAAYAGMVCGLMR